MLDIISNIFIEIVAGTIASIISFILIRKYLKKEKERTKKTSNRLRYNLWINNNFIRETNASRVFQNILISADKVYINKIKNVKKINSDYVLLDEKNYNKLELKQNRNYIKLERNSNLYVLKRFDYNKVENLSKDLAKSCNLKIKLKVL